ncbi:Lrp/AsnC family transcriptional regulator [Limnovirga soli]|jgi:DNA-binding Lrp family transcriptional regulator|uniref:Winged helix-turn-helix transcriptional regulator n=1 Tax=Limnovirga soli TaxID=2656915 RepID=A0A8J8FB94_9BACT|nr:Lrp/AsnC family transcriptional regulator [Limnovirga soli]NNV54821.1 winged helix-turn-helix transcriptional regulator [Limnovirga soli]
MAKTLQTAQSTTPGIPLDDKDLLILRLLQQNARITVKEISEKIHLSTTPVHERIKRMEDNGVIQQYAALLDPSKVKKGLMVICYVSLKEHNKNAGAAFIQTIHELTEVVECYNISGQFDFMLKVLAENMEDYYNFHVNKLSQSDNIGQVQSVFVMGIIKQTHVLVH